MNEDENNNDRQAISQQKRLGFFMVVVMWMTVFAILAWFFSDRLEKQNNPNQQVLSMVDRAGKATVELRRNRQGHYIATGKINNQDVVFIIDTGATDIAVPQTLADKLGLIPGRRGVYQTANGKIEVFSTRLESVVLGDIVVNNVSASINPGMDSDEVLLGMSFLKNLEFTQRGNILTLRQF
ncbi:MAG: TIGR02281 family clan AA aspartic protease [Thiohalomonadales bacterium]